MFPKNSGTPKSSILIGFSIINHPFWGSPIFGNIHITSYVYDKRSIPRETFFLRDFLPTFHSTFAGGCFVVWPKNPTRRGYDQPQPPKSQPQKSPEIPPHHPTSSWHLSFRLQPAPLDLQEPWRKRRRPKHLQRTGFAKRWPCASTKRLV